MKQTVDLKGATIQAVEVLSEDDAVVYNGWYGAYEIVILTDKGLLRIAGCNDSGPDVDMIERSDKGEPIYYIGNKTDPFKVPSK